MDEVMEKLIDYDKLIISFAAGLPISYYEDIKPDIKLIRAMSNLAIFYLYYTYKAISFEIFSIFL